MTKKNIEGVVHALLTDVNKVQCEFCNGTKFQLGDQMDESTDFPYNTKAWKLENSTPTNIQGNMYMIPLLCNCGKISGILAFCLDVCSARGLNSITGTAIACVAAGIPPAGGGGADNLKGLMITLLGGDDAGTEYEISANTEADPTVMTIVGTPAANTVGELILLSSFKLF